MADDDYLLNRDASESKRQKDQHELWAKALDYNINPVIASQLPATAQIADVGTGTGIWAQTVATAKPNYKITGFDISAAQLPEPAQRPANVLFRLHDLRQPFPPELRGRFDLVHGRLLMVAVADQDAWHALIANVVTLLKPGGWLQWEEGDFMTMARPMRSGPAGAPGAAAMRRGFHKLIGLTKGRREDLPVKLGAAFERARLTGIDMDMVASDRAGDEYRKVATYSQIRVLNNMMKQWRQDNGQTPPLERTLEEDEAVIQAMMKEMDNGAYVMYFIFCMLGRKPA